MVTNTKENIIVSEDVLCSQQRHKVFTHHVHDFAPGIVPQLAQLVISCHLFKAGLHPHRRECVMA